MQVPSPLWCQRLLVWSAFWKKSSESHLLSNFDHYLWHVNSDICQVGNKLLKPVPIIVATSAAWQQKICGKFALHEFPCRKLASRKPPSEKSYGRGEKQRCSGSSSTVWTTFCGQRHFWRSPKCPYDEWSRKTEKNYWHISSFRQQFTKKKGCISIFRQPLTKKKNRQRFSWWEMPELMEQSDCNWQPSVGSI